MHILYSYIFCKQSDSNPQVTGSAECYTQTCHNLCNSYVPEDPAQLKFCISRNRHTYGELNTHTQWSPAEIQTPTQWHLISCNVTPAACVIIHHYSSATLMSLFFHDHTKNSAHVS